jgi:pyruvate, water dikinase
LADHAALIALDDPAASAAERVGPKAATLARLARAGLPVPEGVVVPAEVYRAALAEVGVAAAAARWHGAGEAAARRLAVEIRLGLLRAPLPALRHPGDLVAVRSSALLEDTPEASAAGQFETFLGVADAAELATAVRACWASLWSTRALRYLRERGLGPAASAMAVLIQRLVPARAAGGGLSRTPDGGMLLTAAWGLGSAVAQGDVVPDRFRLDRDGAVVAVEPGMKDRQVTCAGGGPQVHPVAAELIATPCLTAGEAAELGRLVRSADAVLGVPLEVEWALGDAGFRILQARPLRLESRRRRDRRAGSGPTLAGHPSGYGRGAGPACVVRAEHELGRVAAGDVLVTAVAGPALAAVLPRVAAVIAERGGSTSHLAALARERGLPAVLGVPDATRRIPDGARVSVDGVHGLVRWTPCGPGSDHRAVTG